MNFLDIIVNFFAINHSSKITETCLNIILCSENKYLGTINKLIQALILHPNLVESLVGNLETEVPEILKLSISLIRYFFDILIKTDNDISSMRIRVAQSPSYPYLLQIID